MKGWKKWLAPIAIGVLAAAIAGCGGNAGQSDEILIGTTAGPHAEIAQKVADEAAKQGIKLKVVEFTDYVTPNKALAQGDIQMNNFQHQPYLDNFNKQNGTDIVSISRTEWLPMGLYSQKVHAVKDIPNGATVAIPNDPTNGGRALLLLERQGLLQLTPNVGAKATVQDIIDNPKHLVIKELDAAQLPRSLEDMDVACIPMNYALSAKLDVDKLGFGFEGTDQPFSVIVLAVNAKDKDNPNYKKIADIYHSQPVKDYITNTFHGAVKPVE